MPRPTIKVLGVYKVELSAKLLAEAMETKYGGLQLSAGERIEAEETVRQELSSVVLIDVLVNDPDKQFDVGDFGQRGLDQAPYDEAYLSLDRASVTSRFEAPATDSFRVAFFLHFYNPLKPLTTSYGEVPVPAVQAMPKRFQEMLPYTAVD
ncbi:hypothetical protein [Candidatus Amarolinea dominans]|uniref:hypothetical protein n=1 Tax=Candidatus Amarolinea dominans TaxID=3140696 RepID=UPI0031360307|nr:hypothetical protein [Anaerolineae bacterium]MBK9233369.1 hypothetical protein [Anaerolineae bacterium]